MKKFIIVSPRQTNGGSIVLHYLCKLLEEKNYNAKVFYLEPMAKPANQRENEFDLFYKSEKTFTFISKYFFNLAKDMIKVFSGKLLKLFGFHEAKKLTPYIYEPVKKVKRKYLPWIDSDTIVVYPDICYGNILNADKVVRWLLYHNRFKNDKNAYSENDLFFCYREFFNDINLNPEKRILKLNHFDSDLYRQYNFEERHGNCYVIRKGKNRKDLPESFDGPILDNMSEHEIVAHFNKCKYCYFYDTQTFYTRIAIVCGCIPIIVCEEGKSKEDYLGPNEYGYGAAYNYSEEEINFAVNTRNKIFEQIESYNTGNRKNLDNFIKTCEEYFN